MRRFVAAALAVSAVGVTVAAAGGDADPHLRSAQAFVARHCSRHAGQTAGGGQRDLWVTGWTFNALYGACGSRDGHNQRVWFFAKSRFVGNDAKSGSGAIVGLWRDDRTIAVLYVLYRPTDPLCCPTGGGAVVRFRWTGRRVVRLDPLPPWDATASRLGRYP